MKFISVSHQGREGTGLLQADGQARIAWAGQANYPGSLDDLVQQGPAALRAASAMLGDLPAVDLAGMDVLAPLRRPGKIVCIGLNYVDHSKESGFEPPSYPAVFSRYASSLIGHGAPIVRPRVSQQLDYEGELVVVIGKHGRHIPVEHALEHVLGYSVFNDGSVRDYQFKSQQWTLGKNFDDTGAFGPALVTADELPPGAKGLKLQTRLNGEVVQSASTDDMIFDVATLVSLLSEAHALEPGDLIVSGTPAGVGLARNPKLWMKPGDVCEVEIEGIGTLRSPIVDEARD
jgi:2-keto-4-pentenoate hydratase/2-oxohepta-3-ene-1,7-dioic acid hydratase in catechol pathway